MDMNKDKKHHQILTWYLQFLFCGCTNSCLNAICIWAMNVREKIISGAKYENKIRNALQSGGVIPQQSLLLEEPKTPQSLSGTYYNLGRFCSY